MTSRHKIKSINCYKGIHTQRMFPLQSSKSKLHRAVQQRLHKHSEKLAWCAHPCMTQSMNKHKCHNHPATNGRAWTIIKTANEQKNRRNRKSINVREECARSSDGPMHDLPQAFSDDNDDDDKTNNIPLLSEHFKQPNRHC